MNAKPTHRLSIPGPPSKSLKLLLTNAGGLSSKLGELRHNLFNLNIDIAIVTETKFTTDKCS